MFTDLIGSGRPPLYRNHVNEPDVWVDVEEDAVIPYPPTEGSRLALETDNIAAKRVCLHFSQGSLDVTLVFFRGPLKLFFCRPCDSEVPGHRGVGRG